MSDETKNEAKAAAEAPAKVVATVAETAEKVVAESNKAVTAKRAKAKAAKTRAAKTKKTKATAKKTTARRAAPKRQAKRAAKSAAAKTERTKTMNFDANKMFAFDAVPGADRFQALFAGAGERSQEMVAKSQKAAEELAEITKANVEALAEAGRIATNGARAISQDALASGRESIERTSAAVRTLADAKSPTEFFQLQSELARASFDRAVIEGSKFTEQMVKLAGEAVQPLSTRASLNAERINKIAA